MNWWERTRFDVNFWLVKMWQLHYQSYSLGNYLDPLAKKSRHQDTENGTIGLVTTPHFQHAQPPNCTRINLDARVGKRASKTVMVMNIHDNGWQQSPHGLKTKRNGPSPAPPPPPLEHPSCGASCSFSPNHCASSQNKGQMVRPSSPKCR